ncbi:hypothetical protein EON81_04960, partial [bacterium]
MLRNVAAAVGAAMLSGALLTLSLPLGEHGLLIWFTLVPLLVATRGKGFLFGFFGAILSMSFAAWISSTGLLYAHRFPEFSSTWVYAGFGKYGMSFALVFGVWGEKGTRQLPLWAFAALGVLSEAAQLFQLPAHLALSLYRHAAIVQLASVGGIWAISYLVWWANFLLADWIPLNWRGVRDSSVRPLAMVGGPALLLLITQNLWLPISGETRRYAALQTESVDDKDLTELQSKASKAGATLVVWPEFAGNALVMSGDAKSLQNISALPGMVPFTTSFQDDFPAKPHNVAAIFSNGTESARYEKRRLFGGEVNDHTAGSKPVAIDGVGLNICFDSCFPSIVRETVLQGAEVVALPTIDPASTNHFLAAVHASYTPFRSAESGVAFVRGDARAYSMITDARGKIVKELVAGDQILVADVPRTTRATIYKALGDWFLPFSALLFVAGIVQA